MEPEHTHAQDLEVHHDLEQAFEMDIDHRKAEHHMNDFESSGWDSASHSGSDHGD